MSLRTQQSLVLFDFLPDPVSLKNNIALPGVRTWTYKNMSNEMGKNQATEKFTLRIGH